MFKTTFRITGMDCPSEEQLIRTKLAGMGNIQTLRFDIPARKLEIYHTGDSGDFLPPLESLQLGATLVSSEEAEPQGSLEADRLQTRVLWQVLVINLLFFVVEIISGLIASSMGLVADSIDMLADSIVYGLSLFAVGGVAARKRNIAAAAGYFQAALGILGLLEVIRRFVGHGETPDYYTMIGVSVLALAANATCLYLLQRSKSREVHMQASMIFTSMDVIANLGVILAGALVYLSASKIPDLAVGTIVFIIIMRGSYRILQLAR
ncbi:MAG TPA: cation transporter [Deltaproteobacteria bacterium]|nr:cation transporter [Deltaproteobacteria bacterium]